MATGDLLKISMTKNLVKIFLLRPAIFPDLAEKRGGCKNSTAQTGSRFINAERSGDFRVILERLREKITPDLRFHFFRPLLSCYTSTYVIVSGGNSRTDAKRYGPSSVQRERGKADILTYYRDGKMVAVFN